MAEKNILLDLADQLVAVANTIKTLADISKSAAEEEYQEVPEIADEPVIEIPLEEVRAVLAEKAHEGKKEEVKALLLKYGADKLSAVDKKNYAALKADAEVL